MLARDRRDLAFYERVRDNNRRLHRLVELVALAAASGTVVAAGLRAEPWLTATIAAVTLFCTGFRQVFGPGPRWAVAGHAWDALRRALDRYQLLPEAERDEAARAELLAAVEAIRADETRQWAERQRQQAPPGEPPALP
ncbi:DUF4231 domain-containing protein [Streptomyces sp. PT12]|uniref:DUF4231 domain-containing protein n=1 Tax=Streptomyces sp. PT12 TaxID=1510197 RepID=UPI0028527A9B|nr:DUF4231 domain-containing protein [Streptomyces sp. PT12]